jgi:hypothetical protein
MAEGVSLFFLNQSPLQSALSRVSRLVVWDLLCRSVSNDRFIAHQLSVRGTKAFIARSSSLWILLIMPASCVPPAMMARMARFVVADITDAKSIPQELAVIVPDLPSVPVQPLLLEGSAEYSMFEHFKRYPWVLETYKYPSSERLIADLSERVIGPAEKWRRGAGLSG